MAKKTNRRYARLQIDFTDLQNLANRSEFIRIEPVEVQPGWPPEKYLITFTCVGIAGVDNSGIPEVSTRHQASLYLSSEYPVKEPSLLWLTDIWHPNIDHKEPRHVCTNAVQTYFSSKPLSELVLSLAEMVQYKRYHAKLEPPFPLDLDAARWVRETAEPRGWIGPGKPLDARPLLREFKIRAAGANRSGEAEHAEHPLSSDGHVAELMQGGNGATVNNTGSRIKLGSAKALISTPLENGTSNSAPKIQGGIKVGKPRVAS